MNQNDSISKYNLQKKKVYLGVANVWNQGKGLFDFNEIANRLQPNEKLILVGLKKSQLRKIHPKILGIEKTESVYELVKLYNAADVFLNPTYIDNFPSTNIEALACGTPVVTYNTGGSPEAINNNTGMVIEKGNQGALLEAARSFTNFDKLEYQKACRQRAVNNFNKNQQFQKYLELYNQVNQN